MYEELNGRIPDMDAYFERLKIERQEVCDESYLNKLIQAHQCQIPFENLDIIRKREILLGTADVYKKVVVQKRGGFCFELNSLFCSFLNECGFYAYPCRSRIVRAKDFVPPVLHRGTLVKLSDGIYYCDVGYGGPQPGAALKIADGYEKEIQGRVFGVCKADDYWWTIWRQVDAEREDVMQITTMPQTEADFVPISYYCANSPKSVHTQRYYLNRRLENGSVSMVGSHFTKTENGVHTEEEVESKERLVYLIEREFGIPNAESLV